MNLNLQNVALSAIVGGIVIAFLVVIVAEVIGRPVASETRQFVFNLFLIMATTAGTWLAASKATNAATSEMFRQQRVEVESLNRELKTLRAE